MLILRDVLAWPAADVAELLGTTTTAVNSSLRRARAQLTSVLPVEDELAEPDDPEQRALLDRFAAALENADANALSELLREDVVLEMPPIASWFAGREAVTRVTALHLLIGPGQLLPTPILANGQPAFALYRRSVSGRYEAHAVLVLTLTSSGIARMVSFLDSNLFSPFGLPEHAG